MSGADELMKFAADLGKVASRAIADVEPVLKKGAQNIKNDLQRDAAGSDFRGVIPSISYDPIGGLGSLGYEVGPDNSRQGGALGHIAYLGTSRGGGTLDLEGPLERERPALERELGRVVDKLGDALE